MSRRLTVEEKTRREIKAWLGCHGFFNFASTKYNLFNETELNDLIINAMKEGMNTKWEKHVDEQEWLNGNKIS